MIGPVRNLASSEKEHAPKFEPVEPPQQFVKNLGLDLRRRPCAIVARAATRLEAVRKDHALLGRCE
jgi:hypothetical protein